MKLLCFIPFFSFFFIYAIDTLDPKDIINQGMNNCVQTVAENKKIVDRNFKNMFMPGDLIYGRSEDRHAIKKNFNVPENIMPTVIDIYHTVFLTGEFISFCKRHKFENLKKDLDDIRKNPSLFDKEFNFIMEGCEKQYLKEQTHSGYSDSNMEKIKLNLKLYTYHLLSHPNLQNMFESTCSIKIEKFCQEGLVHFATKGNSAVHFVLPPNNTVGEVMSNLVESGYWDNNQWTSYKMSLITFHELGKAIRLLHNIPEASVYFYKDDGTPVNLDVKKLYQMKEFIDNEFVKTNLKKSFNGDPIAYKEEVLKKLKIKFPNDLDKPITSFQEK